jgi:hypothetical protein
MECLFASICLSSFKVSRERFGEFCFRYLLLQELVVEMLSCPTDNYHSCDEIDEKCSLD